MQTGHPTDTTTRHGAPPHRGPDELTTSHGGRPVPTPRWDTPRRCTPRWDTFSRADGRHSSVPPPDGALPDGTPSDGTPPGGGSRRRPLVYQRTAGASRREIAYEAPYAYEATPTPPSRTASPDGTPPDGAPPDGVPPEGTGLYPELFPDGFSDGSSRGK